MRRINSVVSQINLNLSNRHVGTKPNPFCKTEIWGAVKILSVRLTMFANCCWDLESVEQSCFWSVVPVVVPRLPT